jgi:hypothetical protein
MQYIPGSGGTLANLVSAGGGPRLPDAGADCGLPSGPDAICAAGGLTSFGNSILNTGMINLFTVIFELQSLQPANTLFKNLHDPFRVKRCIARSKSSYKVMNSITPSQITSPTHWLFIN